LALHLRHMKKHPVLAIVGCVSVACKIASVLFSDALLGIIHDLSFVQTLYMVHMMTDDDTQAALVLKLTVGLCVFLDEGMKIGEIASLLYAVYVAFLVADAVVYHLAFVGLLGLFSVLELSWLSDVCKLCLFVSVYDMAERRRMGMVAMEQRVADAA
jgi:hypothetical protein